MVEKHNNKSFFESFENLERERERERERESFDRLPLPPHTAPLRLTHILITNFFFPFFFFGPVVQPLQRGPVFVFVGVLGWACCILLCLDFFKAQKLGWILKLFIEVLGLELHKLPNFQFWN